MLQPLLNPSSGAAKGDRPIDLQTVSPEPQPVRRFRCTRDDYNDPVIAGTCDQTGTATWFRFQRRTGLWGNLDRRRQQRKQRAITCAGVVSRSAKHRASRYGIFADSPRACFKGKRSGSASFQSARNSWYSDFVFALSPETAYARANCRCASAPIGSPATRPR